MTFRELRNSCLIPLLCFHFHHSPPGAGWFIAMTSNLLPAISACGGWDEVSSSHIRIGFSPFKPPGRETNLPAWAYEPVCRLLCNAGVQRPPPPPPPTNPRCGPSMNTEDRCYPAVCLIFSKWAQERGGRSFWRAPACWICCLSDVSKCFILRGLLFPEGISVWLHLSLWIQRPSCKIALQRRLMWHQGNFSTHESNEPRCSVF